MASTYKKSRRPYDLSYDDYDNFLLGIPIFAEDHSSDPDFYPKYALIPPLIEDYHEKYSAYVNAQNLADVARDAYIDDSINPLRDALVGLRRLLPALFDDDSMLGAFGINKDIETDVDKLIVQAEICRDHWAQLCDPDIPPEYLPVQGKLDAIAGLVSAVLDSREAYAEATRDVKIAQNELLAARELVNHEERRMFNWYRGLYTDPQDEFWTETPWGKAGGSSSGGTSWNAAPRGKLTKAEFPLKGLLAGCEEYTGTTRFDFRIVGAKKNEPIPEMPLVDWRTNIEQPTLVPVDFPLEKGYVYYLWIRARKGEEVSAWSDVVGIEWTEG